MCKWTCAAQACIVQGSTVHIFTYFSYEVTRGKLVIVKLFSVTKGLFKKKWLVFDSLAQ